MQGKLLVQTRSPCESAGRAAPSSEKEAIATAKREGRVRPGQLFSKATSPCTSGGRLTAETDALDLSLIDGKHGVMPSKERADVRSCDGVRDQLLSTLAPSSAR